MGEEMTIAYNLTEKGYELFGQPSATLNLLIGLVLGIFIGYLLKETFIS